MYTRVYDQKVKVQECKKERERRQKDHESGWGRGRQPENYGLGYALKNSNRYH